MSHFSRRLSEILGDRSRKPRRVDVARDLAKAALEHTRAARQKQAAIRACRRQS